MSRRMHVKVTLSMILDNVRFACDMTSLWMFGFKSAVFMLFDLTMFMVIWLINVFTLIIQVYESPKQNKL